MTYRFWNPTRPMEAWRQFIRRVTGREDRAEIERHSHGLQRAEAELKEYRERIVRSNQSNEELRKRLNEISTSQIDLAQKNQSMTEKLRHAHAAVRLYHAAAKVMDEARTETFRME